MNKIHAFTGDNATSNDTQVAWLQEKNNSFDASNHVRCFNHTIQLSCKVLLKPFTSCIASSVTDNNDMLDLEGVEEDDDKDESEDKVEDLAYNTDNDTDDDINELDALSGEEKATFLEATVAVKEAVTKVRTLSFMRTLLPFLDDATGLKTVVHNHPLDYNHIASMALYLQGQPPQAQFDSTRCCHPMELHLRYAMICCQISDRH
jgi:hypothetical protein